MGKRGPKPKKAERMRKLTDTYANIFFRMDFWLEGEAKPLQEIIDKITPLLDFGDPIEVIHDYGATITEVYGHKYVIQNNSQRERLYEDHKAELFYMEVMYMCGDNIQVKDLWTLYSESDQRDLPFPLSQRAVIRKFTEKGWYVVQEGQGPEYIRQIGFEAGKDWEKRKEEFLQEIREMGLVPSLQTKPLIYENMRSVYPEIKDLELDYLWAITMKMNRYPGVEDGYPRGTS